MKLKQDWGELLSLVFVGIIIGIILTLKVVQSDVNGNQVIIEKLKIKGNDNTVIVSPDQNQEQPKKRKLFNWRN